MVAEREERSFYQGFEAWPERVSVVPEVEASATKPLAMRSYFAYCLIFHLLSLLSLLSAFQTVVTTLWMNKSLAEYQY